MGFYIFALHDLCMKHHVTLILFSGPAVEEMLTKLF